MPTVSRFYGIKIMMYHGDHNPPHFHVEYGEVEAAVDIRAMRIIDGHMPPRIFSMVREWAMQYRGQLLENWELCARKQNPFMIPPLR